MNTPDALETINTTLEQLKAAPLPPESQERLAQLETAVHQLADELAAARQAAVTANQERLKFVSVVTHELRLPLTSMKGYTDLLRQGIVGPVNDQQKNFLNVVRNNVERMSALITDLADMSHLQSGRLKLQLQPTNLQTLLDDLTATFQPRFEEKEQKLLVQNNAGPIRFQSDQGRLLQILGTLLANSNRYTPKGGEIRLNAALENQTICFNVSDNGIGISADDQAKLFTPFFRSDHEAVREYPGWGLALHVARLLVELMDGKMDAKSRLGEGSSFSFSIPFVQL